MRVFPISIVVWVVSALLVLQPSFSQSPTPTPLQGDINQDGTVDAKDLLIVERDWHQEVDETSGVVTVELPNLIEGARPMRFVRIPKGSFLMGATDRDHPQSEYALPVHSVTIEHDFYMGQTEVTQGQYHAIMDTEILQLLQTSQHYGIGPDYPVYSVTWDQVSRDLFTPGTGGFLEQLNALGIGVFRLPSEAEWEYACRGSVNNPFRYSAFYFGDGPKPLGFSPLLDEFMWWVGNDNTGMNKVVATRKPNDYGLYDMAGNVSEWCQDYYHPNYIGAPTDGSAWCEPGEDYRSMVIRGGDWREYSSLGYSQYRFYYSREQHSFWLGFRLVFEPAVSTGTGR